jgi:crotonobetainyl-CoA:carnitine CoA-transferase CaiB-like acyl-CoA transferase
MVLGDLGADVIRVDPPGGPSWADPVNTLLQRGKRSIALDLTASVLDTLGMAAALDQLVAASVVATGLPEGEDMIGRFRAPGAAPAQNPN